MNPPRANKTDTPPKTTTKPTRYEISIVDESGRAWLPVAEQVGGGAHAAIRAWAEKQDEKFTGGKVRAVPVSRITTVPVKVETKRQLTLGAPAS